jgi:hypothetical protein
MPPPTPVPSVSIIMSVVPRPAPSFHSASAAALASFSIPAGTPNLGSIRSRRARFSSGMFTDPVAIPRR